MLDKSKFYRYSHYTCFLPIRSPTDHWRNNRQKFSILPFSVREKNISEIVAIRKNLFGQRQFPLQSFLPVPRRLKSMNEIFGSILKRVIFCVWRVCARIWIINSSHEWKDSRLRWSKKTNRVLFFSIVNNWLMLFIKVFCIYTIAGAFYVMISFVGLCKSFLCESLNKCTKLFLRRCEMRSRRFNRLLRSRFCTSS